MEEKILFKEKANIGGIVSLLVVIAGISFTFLSLAAMPYSDLVDYFVAFLAVGIISICLAILIIIFGRDSGICITDSRVYGKTVFAKRVDIPLDSVSSVGLTNPLFNGIVFSSNSGKISFYFIANRNQAHQIISDLIIKRQNKIPNNAINQVTAQSNADELKKYKELLDNGVITQEEFETKKKQLLDL